MGRFAAQVHRWVQEKGHDAVLAVRNEAAQRVFNLAQTPVAKGGNMPVKTGFLRASPRATKDGSLPMLAKRPGTAEDNSYDYNPAAILAVIASAELQDVITFAYTANYARFVENKRKFVALAAQQWPQMVDEVCAEAKRRFG